MKAVCDGATFKAADDIAAVTTIALETSHFDENCDDGHVVIVASGGLGC